MIHMASLTSETVDLKNYIEDAQPFIIDAIKDPIKVPNKILENVASVIVNRAWEDPGYHSNAALLCYHINAREYEQQIYGAIPSYIFRHGMLNKCRLLMNDWQAMRQAKTEYWLSYCQFIANIYKLVRPGGQTLKALRDILAEILTQLACPECINNFEEANLLCTLFHDCGRDLYEDDDATLSKVVELLRNAYLDNNIDHDIQGLMLPLIELFSSKFELSEEAKKFYFQM